MQSCFIDGNKFNFDIEKKKKVIKKLKIHSSPKDYELSLIGESVEKSINKIIS